MKKLLFASLLAMSLLASCDKEDLDRQAPVLSVTRTNPVAVSAEVCGHIENNVIKVSRGERFTIAFTVTDNYEVEQYKVELHDNSDCHGHGRSPQHAGHWEIFEIVEVDAQRIDATKTYTVPQDADYGNYHLQISAIDDNGNESNNNIFYTILVEEDSTSVADNTPPSIDVQITTPAVSAAAGNAFAALVNISDNMALSGSKLTVTYRKPDTSILSIVEYTTELDTQNTSVSINTILPIDATFTTGMYITTFVIEDAAGNEISMQKVFSVI